MRFNMKQEAFPSNVIAGFFRFQPSEFFSVPEAERATPRVSLRSPS
jgi:LemA protein